MRPSLELSGSASWQIELVRPDEPVGAGILDDGTENAGATLCGRSTPSPKCAASYRGRISRAWLPVPTGP
ncbi:MAG TPA: hypothetical protein VH352_05265, partial [Pseudonocardiaceae bacterium]|nr:hypothetical protein [Pseudonocardiaceae bacterium]